MRPTLVVGYHGTEPALDALALADLLARTTGASLLAAYVFTGGPAAFARDPELRRRLVARLGEVWRERHAAPAPDLTVLAGHSAAEGLDRLARERDAAMIVVGSSIRGPLGRVLIGSTPERLLHGASHPVAVAPNGYAASAPERLTEVGVGFDGGPEGVTALTAAVALAASARARLHAVTAVRAQPGIYVPGPLGAAEYAAYVEADQTHDAQALRDAAAALDTAGVEVVLETPGGYPPEVLRERSKTLDLLVLGSRCYGPLRRVVIGSVSTYLTRHAACPLLVLPRAGEHDDSDPHAAETP